ncbi:unnamed protein product [Didymodactylos carnosus]|uniref:EF-hand domain-containing protein n=1 Tax=Didymodactylos carnosus TaxID=1234261 RepID=A0A813QUR0_9BILA|nr:unnamed protein product [Didymodactylos carnosus]CAF1044154.1 unnamed protein product [Didymodactylos carnosus]CAF3554981.1 unnamed protein product [Didymodactylos carnosus]CAF3812298.1 unnamed protein product [Didymodactylos carnosus]
MPQFSLSEQTISNYCTETGFTEQEIIYAYTTFMRDCPNGRCSKSQFKSFMRKSQSNHVYKRTKNFFHMMFSIYDLNKDGEIDFKEYLYALSAVTCVNRLRMIATLFEFFDTHKRGFITKCEFEKKKKMANDFLHLQSNEEEITLAFQSMDMDNDGLLTKEEFTRWHLQQGSCRMKTENNIECVQKQISNTSPIREDTLEIKTCYDNTLESNNICSPLIKTKKIKKLKGTISRELIQLDSPIISDNQTCEIRSMKITQNDQLEQKRGTKGEKLRRKKAQLIHNLDQIKNTFSDKITTTNDHCIKKDIVNDELQVSDLLQKYIDKEKTDVKKHRKSKGEKGKMNPINAWLDANIQSDVDGNCQESPINNDNCNDINNHFENKPVDNPQRLSVKENRIRALLQHSTIPLGDIDQHLFRIFRKARNRFCILSGASDNTSSIDEFKSTDSGILTMSVYSTISKSCSSFQSSIDSSFLDEFDNNENDLHSTNENMIDLFDSLETILLQILIELRQQNQTKISKSIIQEDQSLKSNEPTENKFNDAVNNCIDDRIRLQKMKSSNNTLINLSNDNENDFGQIPKHQILCKPEQLKSSSKKKKNLRKHKKKVSLPSLTSLNLYEAYDDGDIKICRL